MNKNYYLTKCRIREKEREGQYREETITLKFYTLSEKEAREIAKTQLEQYSNTDVLSIEVLGL